jgi:hypothetical protein
VMLYILSDQQTRCGGKQRPFLQSWPYVWMQSAPSKRICSPPKLYHITRNENAKQKTRCRGNAKSTLIIFVGIPTIGNQRRSTKCTNERLYRRGTDGDN